MNTERLPQINHKKAGAVVSAGVGIGLAVFSSSSHTETHSSDNLAPISISRTKIEQPTQLIDLRTEPKRSIGEWTDEQVLELAESMESRVGLPLIQEAGKFLRANQNGEPYLDVNSDYFADKKDKNGEIIKIKIINKSLDNASYTTATLLDYNEKKHKIRVPAGNGFADVNESSKIYLSEVYFNSHYANIYSPFGMELSIATELMKYKSGDKIMHYLEKTIPAVSSNDDERRAGFIHDFRGDKPSVNFTDAKTNKKFQMSILALMSVWSTLETVPDYLSARDKGLLTIRDIDSFKASTMAASYLLENKLLIKNGPGEYEWYKDQNTVLSHWFALTPRILTGDLTLNSSPNQTPAQPTPRPAGPQFPGSKPA